MRNIYEVTFWEEKNGSGLVITRAAKIAKCGPAISLLCSVGDLQNPKEVAVTVSEDDPRLRQGTLGATPGKDSGVPVVELWFETPEERDAFFAEAV